MHARFLDTSCAWVLRLLLFLFLIGTSNARANFILNGDFEDNTATSTQFNLTNSSFNAIVANATSFNAGQGEIDLVTSNDFGIAPQSGDWKLGLHTSAIPGYFDVFSFDLSSMVVAGNIYSLQFFGAEDVGYVGEIEIGLSSTATDFGTLIRTASPHSSSVWTQFDLVFLAPMNASFLTVRSAPTGGEERYSYVDNFSLTESALPGVPLPATFWLFGSGLMWFVVARRRRPGMELRAADL